MLFAKIKEKLLNRRNDIEISEIKDSEGNVYDAESMFAWLDEMKELISYDEENDYLNIGATGIYVDKLKLDELSSIINADEEPFFPLEANAGKVLAVNEDEDGLVAVEKGTKLYKHILACTTEYIYNDVAETYELTIITDSSAPIELNTIFGSKKVLNISGNIRFIDNNKDVAIGLANEKSYYYPCLFLLVNQTNYEVQSFVRAYQSSYIGSPVDILGITSHKITSLTDTVTPL